jgi:dipeptidyl aminopeptidase/acylaminoacyl peptidase
MNALLRTILFAALLAPTGAAAEDKIPSASAYERAVRFVYKNRDVLVLNGSVTPHWRSGDRFTYRKDLGEGRNAFVAVDAATGAHRSAFDHAIVAAGISNALGRTVEPERLPFQDYDESSSASISFEVDSRTWSCSLSIPVCSDISAPAADTMGVLSPNGAWVAFVQDNNLWIRSADGRQSFALTTDGAPHYAYGGTPESNPLVTAKVLQGISSPPVVLWSPDSARLFTQRLDERNVRMISLVQSTPPEGAVRPVTITWRRPLTGDPIIPMAEPWVFDIGQRTGRRVDVSPIPTLVTTSIEAKEAWWSPDAKQIFLFVRSRYYKTMSLHEVDPSSGRARTVVTETGATFVESGSIGQRPMVYTLANGDVIWFSERDGRGHLYLYDGATGRLKQRLTQGDWSVRGVTHLDEARGLIYVAATEREAGADPYHRALYRVSLADGGTMLLTPEPADHDVASMQQSAFFELPRASTGFSPSGEYFLDTYSRTDLPPRTVLRRADGQMIADIENADVSRLVAGGLTTPERFSALAADGRTRLYGNILRPANFDPSRSYPVIDAIYPGPQSRRAQPRFLDNVFDYAGAQSLAELGFIVVLMDGRGTPGRTKTFLDLSYGHIELAGHLDDHVAVIRQLAKRYSYIDMKRVGIYGGSAGGYAALRAMLTYPDVFKAGLVAAPVVDIRASDLAYGETFMGPDNGTNYAATSNLPLIGNLQGKLLLMHGDMDWVAPPSQTLQVVNALIANNKEFDLLIAPNVDHSPLGVHGGYLLQRTWDFFVENLMKVEPPGELGSSAANRTTASGVLQ